MSDPLREALERIAGGMGWAAAVAREALAAAPEVAYEWVAVGRDKGDEPEWLCDPTTERAARLALAAMASDPYDEQWLERRVVGPWECVEVEDGEG